MYISQYIAASGIASRRKAIELIKSGLIKVNGKMQTDPSYKVLDQDKVVYNGKSLKLEKKIYILLNKPKGYITTLKDEKERPIITDLLNAGERLFPIGRLDRDTTGLLLLTNDGDFAQKLSHPSFGVKKIYSVTLNKNLDYEDLIKIKKGVFLKDGKVIVDRVFYKGGKKVLLELHVGRKRIVRRIFESLGYNVNKLDRTGYAGLEKKGMASGQWRFLTNYEINRLKNGKI